MSAKERWVAVAFNEQKKMVSTDMRAKFKISFKSWMTDFLTDGLTDWLTWLADVIDKNDWHD